DAAPEHVRPLDAEMVEERCALRGVGLPGQPLDASAGLTRLALVEDDAREAPAQLVDEPQPLVDPERPPVLELPVEAAGREEQDRRAVAPDLVARLDAVAEGGRHPSVALHGPRAADVVEVRGDGLADRGARIDEPREEPNAPVEPRASAEPSEDGDRHGGDDARPRHRPGVPEVEEGGARSLEPLRLLHERVDVARRAVELGERRDAGSRELLDAAVDLDDVRAGVEQLRRRGHARLGEIAAHERTLDAAADGGREEHELVEGDVAFAVAAPEVDGDAVADRHDVDAGLVEEARRRRVPGHDGCDLAALALAGLQLVERHARSARRTSATSSSSVVTIKLRAYGRSAATAATTWRWSPRISPAVMIPRSAQARAISAAASPSASAVATMIAARLPISRVMRKRASSAVAACAQLLARIGFTPTRARRPASPSARRGTPR